MNIFFHKVEVIVNGELGQGGNTGLRAKDGFSIYDLIFEYIYGIEQIKLNRTQTRLPDGGQVFADLSARGGLIRL
jgi:hypothetical protein